MTDKRWDFELDGAKHSVELKHNPFSNKLSIRVDGKLQTLSHETQQSKERSITHAFLVSGRRCKVIIQTYKNGIEYSFAVDGLSEIPEISADEVVALQNKKQPINERWIVIGLFLTVGIAANWVNAYIAHTWGMYNGWLAGMAPALVLFGIYFMFFPSEFSAQNTKKISMRGWILIVLALLLCFANLYAFEHGLY